MQTTERLARATLVSLAIFTALQVYADPAPPATVTPTGDPAFTFIEARPAPAIVMRFNTGWEDFPEKLVFALPKLSEYMHAQKKAVQPELPLYCSLSNDPDKPWVQVGYPISGNIKPVGDIMQVELPSGKMLLTTHHGGLVTIHNTLDKGKEWIKKNGLVTRASPCFFFLKNALNKPMEPMEIQIRWPIK